jgi:hypothetical protein
VIELIEWFISTGWRVTLFCENVADLMLEELSSHVSQGTLTLTSSTHEPRDLDDVDLVWITHNVWPRKLLSGNNKATSSAKVVSLHMGSLEVEERQVRPEVENSLTVQILVVSGRTQERMIEFGLDHGLIDLFENPVPNKFLTFPQRELAELRSVLFVSNHLPAELAETYRQLKEAGIRVTHVGLGGDRVERLTPELITQFDGVVTIGKTTQYCLVAGIPVYSYDHFGGAGWLSAENFAFEAFNNFTGYATGRKLVAEDITSEILNGFEDARLWSHENRARFANHYSLDRQMNELLGSINLAGKR